MNKLEKKAEFYKALSEPVRLKILDYFLKSKECTCTCHLAKLINRDQSVIFRHLKILEDAGIIKTKKNGCYLLCCIKDKDRIKKYLEG